MSLYPTSFVFQGHIPRAVFGAVSLHHLGRECARLVARESYPIPEKAEEKSVRDLLERAYWGIHP
jgi:hypothetical protein